MNKARVERKTIQTLFGFNLKKNMGKMKNLAIEQANSKRDKKSFTTKSKKRSLVSTKNKQKPEYMIIGSNNFWYASGLTSLAETRSEIKEILKNGKNSCYADPESGEMKDELPNQFYIYKAIEIDVVYT